LGVTCPSLVNGSRRRKLEWYRDYPVMKKNFYDTF